jgi:hypothetical protein
MTLKIQKTRRTDSKLQGVEIPTGEEAGTAASTALTDSGVGLSLAPTSSHPPLPPSPKVALPYQHSIRFPTSSPSELHTWVTLTGYPLTCYS